MLTRRGWWVLGAATTLVACGALVGIQELYALAVAAVVLVAACAAWAHGRQWDLLTVRELHPSRVAAGDVARVELMVRNQLRQRSPVVAAHDPFDAGHRAAEYLVAPLQPGQAERATYRLPTTKRGLFAVGPLELTVGDPFGLVRTRRTAAPPSTLTVHPRIEAVRVPPVGAGADRRYGDGRPVLGAQGDEFFALREYRTGDDLRRVHWTATARTGELMIRQDETAHRGRVTVAIDLRAEAWRPAALEVALSGAASVAVASAAAGLDVRLVHTGGTDTGFLGPGRQSAILDALAVAEVHRDAGAPLAQQLQRLRLGGHSGGGTGSGGGSGTGSGGGSGGGGSHGGGGTLVALTSDAATDADLAAVARIAGRRRSMTLVVVGREGRGHAPVPAVGRSGVSVVWVEPGGSFAAAWDRAVGAGQGALSDV